jgi:long-chain acyl-CoA synthetase
MHPSEHARIRPHKPAFVMGGSGQVVTYAELERLSNQGAQLFRALGLKAGDHVALQLENNRHFMPLVWAARRAGLIYTPISTHLKRDEVLYIVRNCEAKAVICSSSLADLAQELRTLMPGIAHWFMVNGVRPGFESWEDALAAQPLTPIPDEQSGVPMLYSSGTTGVPKGILPRWTPGMPVGEITPDLAVLTKLYNFDADCVYLSPAPLYHAAPLVFNTMVTLLGGTCVIMEKFDAERSLALIQRHQVTHGQWVPIMFSRLLQLPDESRRRYDLASIKYAIHAAAPCPQEVKRRMIQWWGPVIYEYYSSTEGGGFTALDSLEWLAHPGSVGRSVLGNVRIVGDEGKELSPGEIGTVYFSEVRTRFTYYKEPAKTAKAYNEQGWMTVGDVGSVDVEGYLHLSDRKDFMIITGGVNVYPQELENLLLVHHSVADVAVFGIPSDEFGAEVKAVVQPRYWADAGPNLERELMAYCRERLSHIKCPRSIDFERALPRLDNGKLYKQRIRARYLPSA